jgi:type II secretory pathway predicted ATPase ExeA
MYLSHYSLNKKPFTISPDSRFLWLGEKHREALASLEYGIYDNKGFLVLTGNIGTGKTALINRLVRTISIPILVATIPDPGLNTIDFYKVLANEFKLNGHFSSKGAFLIKIKNFLQKAYASAKNVLLIIDEAQRLNHVLLEEIRLLSNIEMDDRKLINIFFVGQSEFSKMLMLERNKATRQRIAANYHLEPLTEKETGLYIQHRLRVAGTNREIFRANAIRHIYHFTRGYPRLINILCDRSMLTGFSLELNYIDASIISECAKELQISIAGEQRPINKAGPIRPIVKHEKIVATQKPKSKPLKKNQIMIKPTRKPKLTPHGENHVITKPAKKSTYRPIKKKNVKIVTAKPRSWTLKFAAAMLMFSAVLFLGYVIYELRDNDSLFSVPESTAAEQTEPVLTETDSHGNFLYNKKLSKSRAEIVKHYFINKGISSSKIQVFGMGQENPIASNDTPEGREKNRRVEIKTYIN